jgi:hypothetical protein
MSWNMRRQMAGEVARFLPPGHSSRVKDMGQFSMPMRTSCSSAHWINGRNVPVDGLEQPFPAPGRRGW